MKFWLLAIICFLGTFIGFSQENLIDQSQMKYLQPQNEQVGGVKILEENGSLVQFETNEQPKFIYDLSTKIPLTANRSFKKGEVFLVSFQARTLASEIETGEGRTHWLLKQDQGYKNNLEFTLSFTGEWKEYFIPFELQKDVEKGGLNLVVQYGYRPQKFQIKDLKFKSFGQTDISKLPKTEITYAGMEPDAAWRKKAFQRINSIRKGDFQLSFFKNNQPLKNEEVKIELKKHDFSWGAAIRAKDLLENPAVIENLKNGFNKVVLENDLKIKSWSGEWSRDRALEALDLLKKEGFKVKGHVLVWPGFHYLTNDFRENKDNPEKLEKLVLDHVEHIVTETQGKIENWDVVNEAYTNQDLQEKIGSEKFIFDAFRKVHQLDSQAGLFTNDYGILSKGGLDTQKQQWYFHFVQRIDENTNGLVDGIGLQSHIGSDLTPPEKVLEILNFFGKSGKNLSISEFTMDIQEPEIREGYTRDFMIAAFSQPQVSEFLFWGFNESNSKKVDIYTKNWQKGAMGKAFYGLLNNEFDSSIQQKLQNGHLGQRGYFGKYKYEIELNGEQFSGEFEIRPGSNNEIRIDL